MKAANISVESYWPGLFAKLAEKRDIGDLILNVGAGGGGGVVAVAAPGAGGGAAAPAAAAPVEEKKVFESFLLFNEFRFASSVCEGLSDLWLWVFLCLILQEEPKEESDDDMGFSLFD